MRAQNINVLTLGNPDGKGVFFPNGLNGVITKPVGFNVTDPGTESIDYHHTVASGQACRIPYPTLPCLPLWHALENTDNMTILRFCWASWAFNFMQGSAYFLASEHLVKFLCKASLLCIALPGSILPWPCSRVFTEVFLVGAREAVGA